MFTDYKIAYMRKHVKVREELPLSFLRQTVSYVLSHSAAKIPHAAAITEFDVTPLVEYGKAATKKAGEGVEPLDEKALLRRALNRNFSAFFIKAIGHVLHEVPALNAFLDYSIYRNGGTLYHAEDVNLSITVHTKHGVMRPIIRNPHKKTLDQVAQEARVLARKARRTDPNKLYRKAAVAYMKTAVRELDFRGLGGLWCMMRDLVWKRYESDLGLGDVPEEDQLQVEDVLGATMTLANIGMMLPAHQTVTVIIPPEVFMLGIGDLHLAPRVVNGEIVKRYVMTVCGTMDHRAFDAGEGFPFHNAMRKYIDNPALIYEWKEGDPN
ncbi:MAG: 2-oxo acid dehydrogenase subunit E2 [Candidatus Hydrogenedentes bacterium]|nr:2-oxo acid dehydrogenase subunit E2 [Candidatus Hydrogenedentota bacterium]